MTADAALATTTNYQAIIRPLQWFVVALIFLFFLRVIRAVYVETRPGGRRKQRKDRRGRALNLEFIEPEQRAGERLSIPEGSEFTVGRSVSCDLSLLDDVYASTLHAKIFRDGKHLLVEDMASTNGTYVNAERIVVPTRLSRNDVVQVGGTILEVTK